MHIQQLPELLLKTNYRSEKADVKNEAESFLSARISPFTIVIWRSKGSFCFNIMNISELKLQTKTKKTGLLAL